MTALHELLRSVERTAELGDPFSAALAREVLVDTVVLRSIMLAPHDWAAQVRPLGARVGAPLDADAAVVVTREGVRAGWAPEVHWDREGRALLVADGPLLGSDATVPIGATVDTYARPIRHVAAHVASRVRGAARVVVIVEPGVEAHILTRVLMSLEAARIRPHLLALAAEDGTAQGVALETVTEDDGAVGVFVRMGGFSARQRGRSVSLPRRRAAERWVFDFDGLDVATRERVRHPVTLRYMGTVAADLVLRVALRLASVDRPVRLVVPTAAPMEER
ncbi:MAG: hypothetical protein M5U28_23405 [Sandaracinaceae bacterium]|nr:hypothetical protein [Sandaracinaceae bacterium]